MSFVLSVCREMSRSYLWDVLLVKVFCLEMNGLMRVMILLFEIRCLWRIFVGDERF